MTSRYLRPLMFLLVLTMVAMTIGGELPWLARVTTPPKDADSTVSKLSLPAVTMEEMPTSAGQTRGSQSALNQWLSQRQHLRQQWLDMLGPLPQPPSVGLSMKVVADESLATCSRTLVKYQAEQGRFVNAYILRPPGDFKTSRPAIVAFHPTNKETIKVVAGTGGRPDQHLALHLVERGFVVICPENYIFEETTWNGAVAAAKKRHPASTGMATMLADGMRAVDVLTTLPGVDPNRIGAIGHSLGAKEVLYLMAFDERVKAGIFSEGGIALSHSNWDADWYLGKQVKQAGFDSDHHELLALIAPRPLLIFGGQKGRAADGEWNWPYVQIGNSVSKFYGESPTIGFINHHLDHSFPPEQAEKAYEWLEAYLK